MIPAKRSEGGEVRIVGWTSQPGRPWLSLAKQAGMSFKMVWKSNEESVKLEDPAKHFRFAGARATC